MAIFSAKMNARGVPSEDLRIFVSVCQSVEPAKSATQVKIGNLSSRIMASNGVRVSFSFVAKRERAVSRMSYECSRTEEVALWNCLFTKADPHFHPNNHVSPTTSHKR